MRPRCSLLVTRYWLLDARYSLLVCLATGEKPDLILLDISMPKMSGEQVAKRLSKIPETKKTPVIFLTALITKHEIEDGGISNIAGHKFIAKPIATKELVAAINNTLG